MNVSDSTLSEVGMDIERPPPAPLIDIRSRMHLPLYCMEMLMGLIRLHRPQLGRVNATASFRCMPHPESIARLHQFAGHQAADLPVPFTYLNSAGSFCLFEVMRQLRINFANVMHLKGSMTLFKPVGTIRANKAYSLEMRVKSILPLKQRCILITETDILDAKNRPIQRHIDHWHVRGQNIRPAKEQNTLINTAAEEFRGLSKRLPRWMHWDRTATRETAFHLPADAGTRYAHIAGDYNLHTTNLGARLFGQRRAFLQGYGVLNLALHHLTQSAGRELEHFEILFTRPALTGQTLTMHANEHEFELCSEEKELVAFGRYRAKPA